jgi:hypothetical protein
VRGAWLYAIAFVAGCDDGWHAGDPIDRSVTGVALIPGADATRVAIALEPRKITRHEHGVLTLGFSTQIVGPTLAVDPTSDAPIGTFALGATKVVIGATRAWVLQSDVTAWEHTFPSEAPPRAPFVHATVLDRATLAAGAGAALAPPIETAVAIGDELFDLPVTGASDAERDIAIRVRADDGSAGVLHAGRGFGAVACAREAGVLVAYQRGDGALVAVTVAAATHATREATFAAMKFDPLAIACDAGASRAAVVTPAGVAVLDVATSQVQLDVPDAGAPFALAADGTAVVATRRGDRVLVHGAAGGVTATTLVGYEHAQAPAVVGDVGVFELADALQAIDLATGTTTTTISTAHSIFELRGSPAGVIVLVSSYDNSPDYRDLLTRLALIDEAGVHDLPLPAANIDPHVFAVAGDHLYMKSYAGDDPRIAGFDLATRAQVLDVALPLCDEAAVLEARGCR